MKISVRVRIVPVNKRQTCVPAKRVEGSVVAALHDVPSVLFHCQIINPPMVLHAGVLVDDCSQRKKSTVAKAICINYIGLGKYIIFGQYK
jgi:hypothetical protein